MNSLFHKGDLGPFLSLRVQMERKIRKKCSEYVITQINNELNKKIKPVTEQVRNVIEAALYAESDVNPSLSHRSIHLDTIHNIRHLLDSKAKERELQNALMDSGLLAAVTCKVIQEVQMSTTNDHRGMRMDLVFAPDGEVPAQVIELKRGTHLLLARRGKPTERLASSLKKARQQLQSYGDRLDSDNDASEEIYQLHGLRIENPELRLIAGRRLANAHEYHLLYTAGDDEEGSKLQIQTWDAFLDELERIVS